MRIVWQQTVLPFYDIHTYNNCLGVIHETPVLRVDILSVSGGQCAHLGFPFKDLALTSQMYGKTQMLIVIKQYCEHIWIDQVSLLLPLPVCILFWNFCWIILIIKRNKEIFQSLISWAMKILKINIHHVANFMFCHSPYIHLISERLLTMIMSYSNYVHS